MLHRELKGYTSEAREFLYKGFTEGFRIPHSGDRPTGIPSNLPSALQHFQVVEEKLNKEIKANRIAGPFRQIPCENYVCSPIGIVPKKEAGKFRLIHHLSYPSGLSVNDGIPKNLTSVSYHTVDDAVKMIQNLGPSCFLALIKPFPWAAQSHAQYLKH